METRLTISPDAKPNEQQVVRFGTRSLFVMLTVLAVIFAGYGYFDRRVLEPSRQAQAVQTHIMSLITRRPEDMTPLQWESAVGWTINLHANSLIFWQADGMRIHEFEQQFAQKLAGDVNMDTIHWIWDEYAAICPGGASYQRYRSQMLGDIQHRGNDCGLGVQ